jgi:glycosyltransferase involved in cell wall biosynthesis
MNSAVLIPAFNEGPRIGEILTEIQQVFEGQILVVDGGSSDQTVAIAESMGARVIHQSGSGYADALRCGYRALLQAGVDRVVQLDADGQHPPASIPRLLLALDSADMVMASREGTSSPSSWDRRLGNAALALLVRSSTGISLRDVTSGYWALNQHSLQLLADRMSADVADANIRILAARQGLRLLELPVYMPDRPGGTSMHDGFSGLRHFWDSLYAVGSELRRPTEGA